MRERALVNRDRVREILSELSQDIDFTVQQESADEFMLLSRDCHIRIAFEYRSSNFQTFEICDPKHPDEGMTLLILRYIFGARSRVKDNESQFSYVGRLLSENFENILNGDFSVRERYKKIAPIFFDHYPMVKSLPESHELRKLLENWDIRWLTEIEDSKLEDAAN